MNLFDKLLDKLNTKRKLYYALNAHIPVTEVYICKATSITPEFIVCHPDNYEQVRYALDDLVILEALDNYEGIHNVSKIDLF